MVDQSNDPCHAFTPIRDAARPAPSTSITPATKQTIIVAFQPPVLFAKIPIVALSKNMGIKPGIINKGEWKAINPNVDKIMPKAPEIKPNNTAFGEKEKIAAQSTATTDPGNNLFEIP